FRTRPLPPFCTPRRVPKYPSRRERFPIRTRTRADSGPCSPFLPGDRHPMSGRGLLALSGLILCLSMVPAAQADPVFTPNNFVADDAAPGAGFIVPTAIAFLPDGRFLIAEKAGKV